MGRQPDDLEHHSDSWEDGVLYIYPLYSRSRHQNSAVTKDEPDPLLRNAEVNLFGRIKAYLRVKSCLNKAGASGHQALHIHSAEYAVALGCGTG